MIELPCIVTDDNGETEEFQLSNICIYDVKDIMYIEEIANGDFTGKAAMHLVNDHFIIVDLPYATLKDLIADERAR